MSEELIRCKNKLGMYELIFKELISCDAFIFIFVYFCNVIR